MKNRYRLGLIILLGATIGAAFGFGVNQIGMGIAIGVAISVAIGTSLQKKNKNDIE